MPTSYGSSSISNMTRLVIYFNELRAWGERLENSSVPQAKYGLRGMSSEEYSWAHLGTKWEKKPWEVSNLVNFMVSLHFKYLRAFYMTERGEEKKKVNSLVFWNLVTSSWIENMMETAKNKAAWSLLPHLTPVMFSCGSHVWPPSSRSGSEGRPLLQLL